MVQFYHAASAASRRAAGTRDGIVSVSKKLAQPAALPAIILAAALMLTVGPSAALRIVDRAGDPATAHRLGTVSSEIQMTAFPRRRSARGAGLRSVACAASFCHRSRAEA